MIRRKKYGLTFEEAMYFLRQGKQIRRAGWHPESKLIRVDSRVLVILPLATYAQQANFEKVALPQQWKPYSLDFFAKDWRVV
jgi:hypothetical protein